MNDIVKDLMQMKESADREMKERAERKKPMVTYVPQSLYDLAKEKAEKQGKTVDEIAGHHIEPLKSYCQ